MYRDAMTAVEQSSNNDSRMVWCEATEDSVYWLRKWANDAARTDGTDYGETHYHDRWEFRGWDYDHEGNECDWCVAVEPAVEVPDVPA